MGRTQAHPNKHVHMHVRIFECITIERESTPFKQICKFHPNGNYLATGSCDRSVRMWDVLNGNCVRIFTGHKVSCTCMYVLRTCI